MANYNNKLDPETAIKAIKLMVNNVPNFIQQWEEYNQKYERFNFKDNITDEQQIDEHINTNADFRHYISTHKNEILDNLDKPIILYNIVDKWSKATPQKGKRGWSRSVLIYHALKDAWLFNLKRFIKVLIPVDQLDKLKEE